MMNESVQANVLAPQLLPCLGSPDSELRDSIAYETLTAWLRTGRLDDNTRRVLLDELSQRISTAPDDRLSDTVFSRSFSALVLSELMRSDARSAFMQDEDRSRLLALAIQAFLNETDFRGLDPELGWIHPLAHQSDLLWRFALHPETTAPQAERILDALRMRLTSADAPFNFNEGDRMARVAAMLFATEKLGQTEALDWLNSFESPGSMSAWQDAFQTPRGMIELHNSKQFLRALNDQLLGLDLNPAVTGRLRAILDEFRRWV
jgi:hypothetical protein